MVHYSDDFCNSIIMITGTGEYTHAHTYIAHVVSFTCFATRGPARANKYCKLRIFLIKLSTPRILTQIPSLFNILAIVGG